MSKLWKNVAEVIVAKDEKKYSEDDAINYCLKQIKVIKEEQKTLNSDRVEALKFYRGDSTIVDVVSGRSKATTTDLMDAVEWLKPSLLEVFTSGDDVVSLDPATEGDTKAVEKQNLLVNMQMKIKNKWFMVLHDWFDDMLKMKTGAVKYQWYTDKQVYEKEYADLTDDEYFAKETEEGAEVLSHVENSTIKMVADQMGVAQPMPSRTHNATIQKTVEDEYPLIEACPAEDIGFPMMTRDVKDANFFWHRIQYEKWEIKNRYGEAVFKKIEDLDKCMDDDNDSVTKARFEDLGGEDFIRNKDNKKFFVYECYYRDREDGTPKLCEICGDIKCSIGPNKYRKPPFHVITPIKMAHRVAGFSLYDLLKELQKIRTALLRQIMDNVYFANNRRYFGDPNRVNMDDYLNNNFPGSFIRTVGDPDTVIKPEEKAPLPAEVFPFWEMLNVEKDYHSGIPRSFQGVNPNVLNKTWRGQNQQISQASQRVSLMIRLISEMGISPLLTDIVDLNKRFLKKGISVKSMNKWIAISPEDIIGKSNAIVTVGLGTGNKDQTIIYMQQLLGLYQQISKAGIKVVSPVNVYNALRELIKAMGIRNIGDFVTDPKFPELIQALLIVLQQKGATQDPQIGMLMMNLAQMMGMLPEKPQEAGENAAGTQSGQEPAAQPQVPGQPRPPNVQPSGGGLFA